MVKGQIGDTKESWWRENRNLILILCGLGLMIISLIIGIVFVAIKNNNNKDCLSISDSGEMRICIMEAYEAGDVASADEMYADALDKAFEAQDYDLFTDLKFDQAYEIVGDDCSVAVEIVDDDRVNSMSDDDRAYYYSNAAMVAASCENSEAQEFYMQKYDDVYAEYNVDDDEGDEGMLLDEQEEVSDEE